MSTSELNLRSDELSLLDEVAQLIVDTVNLELDPRTIDVDAPIFREGLGLDSIDALEIALAVSQRFGFQLRSDDPSNKTIFGSVRALAGHIKLNRTR